MTQPRLWDVLVLGAGAAGLFCAGEAGRRGRSVLLLDHVNQPGRKIALSGGGHGNITHRHLGKEHYLCQQPHFCLPALRRFDNQAILARLKKAAIPVEERPSGQYFCSGSARQIVEWLLQECRNSQVHFALGHAIQRVERREQAFLIHSQAGQFSGKKLVVATGGLSFPKLGASDLGLRLAKQWQLPIIPTRPGLVPLQLPPGGLRSHASLAGLSLPARIDCQNRHFSGPLLFTHRGISGPVVLQISSYWQPETPLHINLLPDHNLCTLLRQARSLHPKQTVSNVLAQWLPKRLAQTLTQHLQISTRLAETADATLLRLADTVHKWIITPTGDEGYRVAEVTTGGVATSSLHAQTMECRTIPGLYFIGEVLDVTGHLGGYNLQWAWSSAFLAAQNI
ncbi:NAD(P)/FAD-dependent oxidoreductase [Candidatus Magnetaquicoccus inordinatus]|uniref:NAD(P)/FAD-dependent oxidoreductase n=1 Tax=Candidatus Magnetaquicoccus inordinatus TaxID=2496818 RepID=UPI00102D1766|nr:NAD(P)/FAD-dependent oxidoreductase [Candidatus Magnetaquicoccus inordinatus]